MRCKLAASAVADGAAWRASPKSSLGAQLRNLSADLSFNFFHFHLETNQAVVTRIDHGSLLYTHGFMGNVIRYTIRKIRTSKNGSVSEFTKFTTTGDHFVFSSFATEKLKA